MAKSLSLAGTRRLGVVAMVALLAFSLMALASAPAAANSAAKLFHSPVKNRVSHGHSNSTSSNWSGYATTGTTYSDVKGSWVEPTVTCSRRQTAYSSFWVGIDGDGTNSVEQTGTDSDCSRGRPTYYAWYEMYPAFPVNLSNPVSPGDSFTAEVKYNGGSSFTLTIKDNTKGWTFTTNQSLSNPALGSAEWIAEAPSSSSGVLPLANFGTVNFTSCTANGVSISSNPNPDEIVMETSNGTVKAQPSGLSGGNSFSVTWHHS
ncbi:MAG TPA: G1 family glutamic endopeptidase [Ktedonobacterales bacterium]|nr:G1 family glutamic endopeptidase [Ktedonobacterales bacterium]